MSMVPVEGFTTKSGLMLDLDNTLLREARKIAEHYCERFRLHGYLIARSSWNNYHVVFDRHLTWRKTMEYLFKIVWRYHFHERGRKPGLTSWAILQACKGSETVRISCKKHKRVPRVVCVVGEQKDLIKEYLEFREALN